MTRTRKLLVIFIHCTSWRGKTEIIFIPTTYLVLPIQSCWKAQFGIWEHGSCGCSGSKGPGDELAEIWGEVGGKPGGRERDPKEKGVDADRSSGWILALEAEREDGLRPYASPSPSQVKRKLWEPPREELSAGSCSCCFLMLAPFKSPLLHGS